MQISKLSVLALSAAFVIGCGKDKGGEAGNDKAAPKTASKVAADKKAATPGDDKKADQKAPRPPADDPLKTECTKLLQKSWTAIEPTLAKVGAGAPDVKTRYTSDGGFVQTCAELSPELRACLGKSENPVAAIVDCKVNDDRKKKLWAPSVAPSPKKELFDAAAQEKQLAEVVGTWKSNWVSYEQKTTWKIAKSGEVEEVKERKGKKENNKLHFTFDQARRIKVKTSATSSQWYAFLAVDKKTFLASTNLAYDAFPAPDKDNFVIWTRSNWIINDGGKCEVVSERGLSTAAECTWSKKGKTPVIKLSYKVAGDKKPDGTPRTSEATYHHIKGHLVDERMVDVGTFKR